MKICILAAASSIHTVRWVNSLSAKGNEVVLVTMHPEMENKIDNRVKIINLSIKSSIGYYLNFLELKKILRLEKPDILNVHYASGYGTLARLAKFEPILLSVWGSDVYLYPYQSERNLKNIKKNLLAATMVASTSFEMKKQILKLVDQDIRVTPFGVDMDLFQPLTKPEKESNVVTIGIVKTLEEIYGVEYLIKAFSLLIRDGLNVFLEIVGEGSQKDNLKLLVKQLGIKDFVTFTGKIPNHQVPTKLNTFDIYCAPSLSESFGVAVVEASACKLPVVVTNVGGLPEVTINERTGFVVPPKNVEELYKALKIFVLDERKRLEFGQNGRDFVESKYNWNDNVVNMEKIYRECIEKLKNQSH